ncbi:unnamed protein product [[Candida] boidinii]|uniref:Unnamed protein product n=1 Tax=Candida boidinii TaxID=5477 RepID=A0ACB5U7G9_CANBO|nr:unnamed protein product [[Candida] boidinii]
MYNQNYLQQQSGDQSNNGHQQQSSQQQYQNSYPYGRNFGTPNSQGSATCHYLIKIHLLEIINIKEMLQLNLNYGWVN